MSSYNFTGTPTGHGTGGDSLTTDMNTQFELANMVWLGVGAAGVWIMCPGIGLLYSGLSRKKHSLASLWLSLMGVCVVSFQWFFWGFSLVFSHHSRSHMLGTFEFFGFRDVLGAPSADAAVPDITYAVFQGMFACVAGVLMVGGGGERARLMPMMIFLFIWMTCVYCVCAHWSWNPNGWLAVLGEYDFAGGLIHQTAGHGALMYALILGRRDRDKNAKLPKYKPHSVASVVLGTVFITFAWFFFNACSAGNASIRAWYALQNTNLAAASGGLTWMFIDYFRYDGKWTTVGLCSGIVSALVGITPGAGYVPVWASMVIGIITAAGCNFAVDLKYLLKIDDGCDVWALHGVGGCIGSVLTGIFAADYVNATAGSYATPIPGGWLNHHWKQVGYQIAGICAICGWTCVVTTIILLIMDRIPMLKIRLSPEEELQGTDVAQIGEVAYDEDNEEDYTFEPQPIRSRLSVIGSITQQIKHPLGGVDDKIEQAVAKSPIAEVVDGQPDSNSNSNSEEDSLKNKEKETV
ncbi:ammonium transporter [Maudiozyma exigua]|uniref:Ammonium transporter n=1 Tax=Maudiozyma exigua TaxID=34358 RepID=A0A9P6W4W2_MAUEX|nr:ammonium transporter [Kazachstania exigua]